MRRDVQEIFRLTPHEKQCMMFSATLSKEIRPVCRKFMQDVSRVTPQLAACHRGQHLSAAALALPDGLGHSATSTLLSWPGGCQEASLASLFPLVCQTGS